MKRTAVIFLLMAMLDCAKAQSFQRISSVEGLLQNSVFEIVQDHIGFVWFGTQTGLQRFDGRNITSYRLTTEYVRSVIFDSTNESVWALSGNKVFKISYSRENIDFKIDTIASVPPGDDAKFLILIDHERILVHCDKSLLILNKSNGEIIQSWKTSNQLLFVQKNNRTSTILAACSQGLLEFDLGLNLIWDFPKLNGKHISCFQLISDETEILLSASGEFYTYDLNADDLFLVITENRYRGFRPTASAIRKIGDSYWIGTNLGIYKYRRGKAITLEIERDDSDPEGITSNLIKCIFQTHYLRLA